MSLEELAEFCSDNGLSSKGKREALIARIVKAVEAGKPVVYAPGKWALIMLVIRNLPRLVFNRMDV